MLEIAKSLGLLLGWQSAISVAIFKFLAAQDRKAKQSSKDHLVRFITEKSYESYLVSIRDSFSDVFIRVFGESHFSIRSVKSIFFLSFFSLGASFCFSYAWNPSGFNTMISGSPEEWGHILETLKTQPKQHELYLLLSRMGVSGFVFGAIALWIGGSILPLYIATYRLRIILSSSYFMKHGLAKFWLLVPRDIFHGLWAFLVPMAITQTVFLFVFSLFSQVEGSAGIMMFTSAALVIMLLPTEIFLLLLTLAIFFKFPFANLFWANLAPSILLWIFSVSAILTRMLSVYFSGFRWMTQHWDIKKRPYEYVGAAAGTLTFVILTVFTAVYRIFWS